ncbi:MAG: hypothetical protein ACOCUH_00530 [Bacteriovoracia bacterium]
MKAHTMDKEVQIKGGVCYGDSCIDGDGSYVYINNAEEPGYNSDDERLRKNIREVETEEICEEEDVQIASGNLPLLEVTMGAVEGVAKKAYAHMEEILPKIGQCSQLPKDKMNRYELALKSEMPHLDKFCPAKKSSQGTLKESSKGDCLRKYLEFELRKHYIKNLKNEINNRLIAEIQLGSAGSCLAPMTNIFDTVSRKCGKKINPSDLGLTTFNALFTPKHALDILPTNMCVPPSAYYKSAGEPTYFGKQWVKFVKKYKDNADFKKMLNAPPVNGGHVNDFSNWLQSVIYKNKNDKDIKPYEEHFLNLLGDMPFLSVLLNQANTEEVDEKEHVKNIAIFLSNISLLQTTDCPQSASGCLLNIENTLVEYFDNYEQDLLGEMASKCREIGELAAKLVCENFPLPLRDKKSLNNALNILDSDNSCGQFECSSKTQINNLLKDHDGDDLCVEDIVKYLSCRDKYLYEFDQDHIDEFSDAKADGKVSESEDKVKEDIESLLSNHDQIVKTLGNSYGNIPFHDSIHDKSREEGEKTPYELFNEKLLNEGRCEEQGKSGGMSANCIGDNCLLDAMMDFSSHTDLYASETLTNSSSASSYRPGTTGGQNNKNTSQVTSGNNFYANNNNQISKRRKSVSSYYNPYYFDDEYNKSKKDFTEKLSNKIKRDRNQTFEKLPESIKDELGGNADNLNSKKIDKIWDKINSQNNEGNRDLLELLNKLRQQQETMERMDRELQKLKNPENQVGKVKRKNENPFSRMNYSNISRSTNASADKEASTSDSLDKSDSMNGSNNINANSAGKDALKNMQSSLLRYVENGKSDMNLKDDKLIMQAYEAAKERIQTKLQKGELTGISIDAYVGKSEFLNNKNNSTWLLKQVNKSLKDDGHVGMIVVIEKDQNDESNFAFVDYKITPTGPQILGTDKSLSKNTVVNQASEVQASKSPARSITVDQLNSDLNLIEKNID